MVNIDKIILGATGTLISAVLSIMTVFVLLIFSNLLNQTGVVKNGTNELETASGFLQGSARTIIETVYPIILVLLPLFSFIGGLVITMLLLKEK